MMYTFLLLVSVYAVFVAIDSIVRHRKEKKNANREWEIFEDEVRRIKRDKERNQ